MAELALEARHFWMAQGPFLQVLHRLHLTRPDGRPRALVIVTIAWLPLFVGALSRIVVGQPPAPILFDISVHARLLIAIPLMVVGERLFALRARDVIDQLYDGHFAERATLDRIIDGAERARDSRAAMVVMSALALFGGVSVLLFGSVGVVSGIEEAGALSFARVWYALVAVPIVQVLLLRWLWQWAIWSYILLRLSRVKLAVIATHPDHAAGLGFLGTPISALAFLIGAAATTRAAGWATEILDGRTTLQACVPSFVVLLIVALALACGPLLAFAPTLYRARHATGSEDAKALLLGWLKDIGYEQHLLDGEDSEKLAAARWRNVLDFVDWVARRCGGEVEYLLVQIEDGDIASSASGCPI